MCIFSQPARVSGTHIFARHLDDGREALVYAMRFAAAGDLAMILPLPVPPAPPEDAVRFVSLEGYDRFFADVEKAFPRPQTRTLEFDLLSRPARAAANLVVHSVGDFEASFVPTLADFERLDARFKLDRTIWDALPQYRDWGFAVFKLKGEAQKQKDVHPMAFVFPRRDPTELFFPTVHIHDGVVHENALYDHMLYCQPSTEAAKGIDWGRSAGALGDTVDATRAHDLIDPRAFAFRMELRGERRNTDWVLMGKRR
jgi:hypothetical protein